MLSKISDLRKEYYIMKYKQTLFKGWSGYTNIYKIFLLPKTKKANKQTKKKQKTKQKQKHFAPPNLCSIQCDISNPI